MEEIKKDKNISNVTLREWEIEVKEEQDPVIVRVIIDGEWRGDIGDAKKILEDIYEKWPDGKKVKFLITCGGFIKFDWPESISKKDIGDNKNPNGRAVNNLVEKAKECANSILDEDLCRKLSKVTDYVALGVDSLKEEDNINQSHIELVLIKDLNQGNLYWTGKSYPTTAQEKGLVRIADLKTHFVDLNVGKVMILVCHDLNIFNPRSKNAKGLRIKINDDFRKLAKKEKPIVVLHLPHTTVKKRTWLNAWSCLVKTSVKYYASSGRYYDSEGKYDPLDEVLEKTKEKVKTLDFIIRIKN